MVASRLAPLLQKNEGNSGSRCYSVVYLCRRYLFDCKLLRFPTPVSNVAAAAVAAAAAAGVGTGGLVAEVEPRPDFAHWTTEDDLQLLDAMEV